MASLPAEVLFGKVTGQLFTGEIDSIGDGDELPEGIPAVGTVTFKPSAQSLNDALGKAIILPKPMKFSLDVNGKLASPDGTIGAYLIASDSPSIQPINFSWNVSFDIVGVSLAGFNFYLPHDTTKDLAELVPASPGSGLYVPSATGPANVVYRHGPPTDPYEYPAGTFVVDVDDDMHLYEITA